MNKEKSAIWYPYRQHKHPYTPLKIKSAKGVYLTLESGKQLIDAISSWWCVIHGYNHPDINAVIIDQINTLPHVMLGGLTHDPAENFANKLVEITPQGLNHVFFADSGSVGCEIALKMVFQFWMNQGNTEKKKILALNRSYHGDTFGVMAVSRPDDSYPSMHRMFKGILTEHLFVAEPKMGFEADPKQLASDIDLFHDMIKTNHEQLAAFICEPIMQGVGGFNLYSPAYLEKVVSICNEYNVLVIFDGVATGFGRTGKLFAAEHAQVTPDLMVLSKALTAGYCGHSATLTTSPVFDGFLSDSFDHAFMHGPTFMGNATACRVGLKSIELFQENHTLDKIATIETCIKTQLATFSHPKIKAIRVLGAMGVIEVHDSNDLKGMQAYAIEQGVWIRPFDRFLYVTPPYVITKEQLQHVIDVMISWF